MPDIKRFDPLGWLLSASFAVLTAAGALVLAVYLVRSVWPWLVAGVVLGLTLAILLRLAFWWRRRQPW